MGLGYSPKYLCSSLYVRLVFFNKADLLHLTLQNLSHLSEQKTKLSEHHKSIPIVATWKVCDAVGRVCSFAPETKCISFSLLMNRNYL